MRFFLFFLLNTVCVKKPWKHSDCRHQIWPLCSRSCLIVANAMMRNCVSLSNIFHLWQKKQVVRKQGGKRKKQILKFTLDCTHPVEDGIMDAANFVSVTVHLLAQWHIQCAAAVRQDPWVSDTAVIYQKDQSLVIGYDAYRQSTVIQCGFQWKLNKMSTTTCHLSVLLKKLICVSFVVKCIIPAAACVCFG